MATLAFFIILMGGAFLRFTHLGTYGFWVDEIFHASAARALLENGNLFIPFEGTYDRALPVTYLTAFSMKLLGQNEFAARLPFALISLIAIAATFLILRRLLSLRIALLVSFMMAFSPVFVANGRDCRMYTPFSLIYFLTAVAFFIGFENLPSRWAGFQRPGWLKTFEEKLDINLKWLGLSAVLLGISLSLHKLSVNFSLVVLAYVLVMGLVTAFRDGVRRALFSKYSVMVLVAGLLLLGALIFVRQELIYTVRLMKEVPGFAKFINPRNDYSYYRYVLSDNYPAFFFLYPLGALLLVRRWGKWGIYLVVNFLVLLIFHTFVFELKAERYIFYAMPFFFIAVAQALDWIGECAVRGLKSDWRNFSRFRRAALLVCALPAVFILVRPWAINALKLTRSSRHPDWKALSPERLHLLASLPVLTANPMEYVYYFREYPPYYFIMGDKLDHPNQALHVYGLGGLRTVLEKNKDLLVVTTRFTYHNPAYFDQDLVEFMEKNMSPVGNTPDTEILFFSKRPLDKVGA